MGMENKTGVATTKISESLNNYGFANRELFTQFVARISKEMPTATVAMFSKLKYVNASNFEKFRQQWNAQYMGGFVVHSKAFDGITGSFPIGFLVWQTNQNSTEQTPIFEILVDVLDKSALAIGCKPFYNLPKDKLLTDWINRPKKNNTDVVPLKNAVNPAVVTKDLRGAKGSDGSIGCLLSSCNDLQHANQQTALFSSGYGSPGAFFITSETLWKVAITFSVRRVIKPTWLNDRDQFLKPTQPLTEDFKTDCLIWMLFNGSNLTASANDLEWNNKKWSIVNHFIPFTEAEVGAPDRFESDFMVQYLAGLTLSSEAQAVLNAGRTLWQTYFAHTDVRTVRDTYKLNRPDVGWYQVRNALAARTSSGDTAPVNFGPMELAYQVLSNKLRPQVFSLGFLR